MAVLIHPLHGFRHRLRAGTHYDDHSVGVRCALVVEGLIEAAGALADGQRDAATLSSIARDELSITDSIEYFELVDPDTLEPVTTVERPVLAVTAARVGKTRLIDNLLLEPHAAPVSTQPTNPAPQAAHLQG